MTDDDLQRILARLATAPATLADLRSVLPEGHPERRAQPSMGEADAFADDLAALVDAGRISEAEGRYRLPAAP